MRCGRGAITHTQNEGLGHCLQKYNVKICEFWCILAADHNTSIPVVSTCIMMALKVAGVGVLTPLTDPWLHQCYAVVTCKLKLF